MTSEHWNRLKDILSLALKHPSAERAAVLDRACRGDSTLRRDLGELVECHDQMGSFMAEPLVADPFPEAAPEDPPAELREWTRYEITGRLGRGGMAVVYLARDPRLHRTVAIKLISGGDELTVKRFLREAEAQARIDHEHVLKVYETGSIGRHHYIAMQHVGGPTLIGVRDETTLDHKVELMLKIAEALHAAHRQGLVHRDIKPGNILVDRGPDGLKPYLLDFGLAVELGAPALTMTGVVVGTPRYMAPERIQGGASALDRRSDIYSLGATFYEFLSGAAPFASTSGLQVLVDVLQRDLTPLRDVEPRIPPELEAIVAKCLEKDPQHRYPSARALADDLRRYLDGDPVLARPAGRVRRIARKARRHPRLAAAFACLISLTLAVAGWGAYGYWRATRQAELAQAVGQEVRDLEWLFRAAQMSPLHPLDGEKQQVRQRMARLQEMTSQVGSLAAGPGNYGLGRAFLALGDNRKALEHLELAWASGYRTADTATALGLAHGEVLRVELIRTQRIADDRARAARIAELDVAHREPALSFLEEGGNSAIVPNRYVEALIASLRGDDRLAVERAAEAARETPWLFEARLLPGHLTFDEAIDLYLSGNLAPAAERAHEADRHYAEAQAVAASSIDAYLGRCAVSGLLLHMGLHGLPADMQPVYAVAEEACARALVVDSANGEAYRLYGDAVRSWGSLKVRQDQHPGDAYERAAHLAERAMELSGGDVEALLTLADTFLDRAWWENRTGVDPRPAVGQAATTYEKALAVDPRNVTAANNLGQALLLRSHFEIGQQRDASASQDASVASFERALDAQPSLATGFRNLARAAIERADEDRRRGRDDSAGLEQVRRFIDGLPGDPALPGRVEALRMLRERLAAGSP